MMKAGLIAAGLLAAAAFSSGPSLATPAPGTLTAPAAQSLLQPVHFCHRDYQVGIQGAGCHYHAPGPGDACYQYAVPMRYCRGGGRYYERYEGYERPRRPRCFTDCRYVGPIKECRRICRD